MNKILDPENIYQKLFMKLVSFWVLVVDNREQGDIRERHPH